MTQKKTMKCPVCGRRAFDISKIPTEQIEVELKCPHCKHIVYHILRNGEQAGASAPSRV